MDPAGLLGVDEYNGGGGGGGVGRIRINTSTNLTVQGVVSPAVSTGAYTTGSLPTA